MIRLKEGQKVIAENGDEYEIEKGDIIREGISSGLKDILRGSLDFKYQMLGRFIRDAEYYLYTNRSSKHLWSGDPISHADNMVALYNSFSKKEKPEWLTTKQLQQYVEELYASE